MNTKPSQSISTFNQLSDIGEARWGDEPSRQQGRDRSAEHDRRELIAFSKAWEACDWAQLETLASAETVAVAQEWYTEGDEVEVSAANIDSIMDGCWMNGEATTCGVLYVPSEGPMR